MQLGSEGAEIVQLCAFGVGAEEYVLDIRRIREIVRPLKVTAVPHAPPYVEGVLHLREAVIPVVDLRRRLGAPLAPMGPRARMLIATVGDKQVALAVDAVLEVMRIPKSAIKPTPPLLDRGPTRFFLGVCEAAGLGRLRLLLNIKALLESDEPVPGHRTGGTAEGRP